jgi:membrane protease YdiL (CAAX protease family)
MASSIVIAAADTRRQPVAPWWHTALVLAPIAIGSVASAYQHGLPNANLPGVTHRLSSYFTVLVEEWVGVFLVWLALRRRGLAVGSLVSGHWQTPRAFFRDLGLAIGFMVVVVPLVGGLAYLLGANTNSAVANIPPKTVFELLVFLALTASAGFGEELVFRGYLTQQFSAWTGSRAIAVVLQGIAFGLAHGFYGKAMLAVMLQGWLLGLLAYWRRSLRPGMLAHWLQDSIGGIVAFFS